MSTEHVDAQFTALEPPAPSQSLAVWTPRFVQTVDEAIKFEEEKQDFMRRRLKAGVHYGVIPGTAKPSLYKPGAEALLSSMGLHPKTGDELPPVKDFMGRDHDGETFIAFQRFARIYRQTGPREDDRVLIAQMGATCNSWESKYRWRFQQMKCPECGNETVLQSKKDDDESFFCWRKKGGCGATFQAADPRITGQKLGRVANENVAELENTILKIADKRAVIAATLMATGCSDIFTQDLEDLPRREPADVKSREPKPEPPSDDPEELKKKRAHIWALVGDIEKLDPESSTVKKWRDETKCSGPGKDANGELKCKNERHAIYEKLFKKHRLDRLKGNELTTLIGMLAQRYDETYAVVGDARQ